MSVLKKLASDTALYGLSSILGRMLNYLLVPLHTSLAYGFARAEYGEYIKLYAVVAFLNVLYTYGMETTFFRYAKAENMLRVYRQIMTLMLLTSSILSGGLIWFAPAIAAWLDIPQHPDWVVYLALIMAIDAVVAIPFARLRWEKNARAFAFIRLANIGVNIALNVFFLVLCRELYVHNWSGLGASVAGFYTPALGIGWVIIANLIANLLFVPMLWRSFADYRPMLVWAEIAPMLRYALPLVFLGLAGMVNQMLDKIVLEYWLPAGYYGRDTSALEAVGVYGACFKLSVFMQLAIQAFKYAAEPFFFAQAAERNAPEMFARVMHYFILVCVAIWVGVSLNIDLIKYFFIPNTAYHAGLGIVPILLLASLILGVYYNLTVWFKLADRTQYGMWISIGGAIVNIAANYTLIPLWGYYGCAVAALLTYGTMAVWCYLAGQQHLPIPYRWGAAAEHIAVASLCIVMGYYVVRLDSLAAQILWANGWLLGFFGWVWVREGNALRGVLRRG